MIRSLLQKMGLSDSATITQIHNDEDGSAYQVWKVEVAGEHYILKAAKQQELDNYQSFLAKPNIFAPKLHATAAWDGKDYLLLEYIPGHDLRHANREDLTRALDALMAMQRAYWQFPDASCSFQRSITSRKNRRNYLLDPQLEQAYDAYLTAFETMPRTLCHDDLLPFNVRICNQRAVLIDWEVAGILPYPTSLVRLIAHGEEQEDAFFFLKSSDFDFAIRYYYDYFICKMGISMEEYLRHLALCLFYEYCEWVYVGNKYGDTQSQRFITYFQKARKLAQLL